MLFRWNEWNVDHIVEHGVSPEEAERKMFVRRIHSCEKMINGGSSVVASADVGFK